ncbi:concanavalin A-like lectin/glucanase domain-containing protein [Mycena sp. CBHHK59/15]|nr:concanavalin A-like lectin/glucanase domain-containing protein [Mycena sp. CBHHK59/15]
MKRAYVIAALSAGWQYLPVSGQYFPLVEYSGTTFFSGFDFYGTIDNTTWGNVSYVDQANATNDHLAYVNANGNAIIKVDNTSTVEGTGILYRNSVRLTSKEEFPIGTLFVIDALHMPYGCSVWPSIWLNGVLEPGQEWPAAGEIDLVESINLMDHNQMALHSYAGCVQAPVALQAQSGHTIISNCNDTTASGCTVGETKPNSFGSGFAAANGGAFALQFDVSGIYMWFWSRLDIPASLAQATATSTMNLSDWGTPSAAYPAAGCNITEFFPAQHLVIDITLCGLWAGIPSIYSSTCPGNCFASNVLGNGSNYANAYFEIPYIRTWTVNPPGTTNNTVSTAPQTTGAASGSVSVPLPDTTTSSVPSAGHSLALVWWQRGWGGAVALVLVLDWLYST